VPTPKSTPKTTDTAELPEFLLAESAGEELALEIRELATQVHVEGPRDRLRQARLNRWAAGLEGYWEALTKAETDA
jgi:hypothetical protein